MLELKGDLAHAADVLTEMAVRFPWFVPALTERAQLLLCLGDWEQMMECVARLLQADGNNVTGLAFTGDTALVLNKFTPVIGLNHPVHALSGMLSMHLWHSANATYHLHCSIDVSLCCLCGSAE